MFRKYKCVLKEKALIHLKTDSQFLHGYTLGILERLNSKIIVSSHDIYNSNLIDKYDYLKIKTFYEKKFLKNNLAITYICFQIS